MPVTDVAIDNGIWFQEQQMQTSKQLWDPAYVCHIYLLHVYFLLPFIPLKLR